VQSNDELDIERADVPDFIRVPFIRKSNQYKKEFKRYNHNYHRR